MWPNRYTGFMIDPITQLSFSIVENPGTYALLIGSGVSRAAEIPTGWEVILDLCRRLAAAEGEQDEQDWESWYRGRFGAEPNYSALLDALTLTPSDRRSILHNYIEPTAEDLDKGRRMPTRAHRAIARLVRDGFIKVIITTNFDRLMETALREAGVEPTVISSLDALTGASPIVHSRCFILKLHGDYLDNRILNTDDELEHYPAAYDALLDRIFDEYGLIVSGWSGEWDPALRGAMLRTPNRRYPLYWAVRGEPSTPAQELMDHRAARAIRVEDAEFFFDKVQQTVETLQRSQRVNPVGIELMLASTKRFLARPEYRIDLNDLVSDDLDKLHRRISGDDFPVQGGDVTVESIAERWQAFENLTEPLARALGLMGRWGDGSEVGLASDAVRLLTRYEGQSGSTAYLALRVYPAYLCFLTYALGLTKAERFRDLHRWFRLGVTTTGGEPDPAVLSLFMGTSGEIAADWWKFRGDTYARIKTPWSVYLAEHIVPWSRDYGLSMAQALDNYHLTELLGGIASLDTHDTDELNTLRQPIWMPHGRLTWASLDRKDILRRVDAPELRDTLIEAGFANGSGPHWDGARHAFNLLAQRIGW